MPDSVLSEFQENVLDRVEKIPCGKVVTHADVGDRKCANVGRALESMVDKGHDLPWHRVVKQDRQHRGLSAMVIGEQRDRLGREGVELRQDGRVDLNLFRWNEPGWGPID